MESAESCTALIKPFGKCKGQIPQFPERTIWKINYLSLIIQDPICHWCPFRGERQNKVKQLTCKKKLHSDARKFKLERFQGKR